MGISWDEVIAHALSLPDTVEGSHYRGRRCWCASPPTIPIAAAP